ncbi:MAG TPA: YHS domain-containing protein [Anaerolineales bacterium]|nr:YHS domain-containing protein [Anaerolineales bacterium]
MELTESKSEGPGKTTAITACGGKLNNPANYSSVEYLGKTVYFCKQACLRVFKDDPVAFMAGDVEHPTEED